MNKRIIIFFIILIFSCNDNKEIELKKKRDIENKVDSLINLAYNSFHKKDNNSAIIFFDEALKLDSENFTALGNQAFAYSEIGDDIKAIMNYTKLIKIIESGKGDFKEKSNLAYYHSERGKSKYKMNDLIGALSDYTFSIENGSDNSGYYNYLYRGVIYLKLGRTNEACIDLSKAGELGNKLAYDYINQYCQ